MLRSANAKDKIYGLLPLSETGKETSVKVDYNKSTGEVYRNYFQHILQTHRSLEPLKDAGIGL